MQNTIAKVAIQGDKASFHEIAALNYFKEPTTLVYCRSFDDVFLALANNEVDKAFVAVSNSNHGEISEVKALLASSNLVVEGEYLLPIQQHIIGLPNTNLRQVRKIISHPVALSQCKGYLTEQFTDTMLEEYHDTSAAVALVKAQADSSVVAIGSDRAAAMHGLVVLRRAVQDDADNATLFQALVKRV